MIRECRKCDQYFGTYEAWKAHLGQRGCKKPKRLSEEGFWQGYLGVWWSLTEGWPEVDL